MVKSKKRITLLLLLFVATCLISVCGLFTTSTQQAYAATTPKYTLQINYSVERRTGLGTPSVTNGTGYAVSVTTGQNSYSTVTTYIYGNATSGTGNLPVGGAINSSSITISTSGKTGISIVVTNSSGTQVGKGTNSVSMSGLSDGVYNVSFIFGNAAWATSARSGVGVTTSGMSSFRVDTVDPTISGASTSSTGKYTNSAFTVSASDAVGVSTFYYKEPNSSSYITHTSTSRTFSSPTTGIYSFYAKDTAGNTSLTYYVYFDNIKPIGSIKDSSGNAVSTYTNKSFSYTGSDANSGISYLQYKKPSSSSWESYSSGTTIPNTSANGAYQFRAVDKAGNISDTSTVYLDSVNPTGTLYGGTTILSSGSKTNANYIKLVSTDSLSGIANTYVKTPSSSSYSLYTSGTQLSENGDYSFYCVDRAGNTSATYTVHLDNVAPTLTLSNGSWGDTLNNSFFVLASDTLNTVNLYYKKPNDSSYKLSATNRVSIAKTDPDGTYYFYAIDSCNNISETKSVNLSISLPIAQIIRADDSNKVCIIWTDNTCTGTLNGNNYVNGTWIGTEGSYTFIITNDANRSRTYTFEIKHYFKVIEVVQPTCLEQGYSRYRCISCESGFTDNYVDALGHNYKITSTASSCTEQGYTTYTCERCGHTYDSDYQEVLGHDMSEWYISKRETCTQKGTDKRDCSRCDYYEERDREALGHSYRLVITQSSCEQQGYTTYTCTRCSHSYISNFKEVLGHEYGSWHTIKHETCIDSGIDRRNCNRCDKYEEKVRPALGHDYVEEITQPTCLDKGYTSHICSRCGEGYIDTYVNALGHDYIETVVKPTCTEKGYIDHSCSRCEVSYKTDYTNATGHTYTEEDVYATCVEDGGRKHTCVICGYSYLTDKISALGHNYLTEVITYASCEHCGERHFHCERCSDEYSKEIPAIEHEYMVVRTDNVDGVTTRTYVCSLCGNTYQQNMGDQYEHVSNYVEFLFNEYSPYMIWVFLATAGVWSIAMGVCFIIAKKNEDKEKARRMIVNYCIGLVVIFGILVACPYLVRGIAFLVS